MRFSCIIFAFHLFFAASLEVRASGSDAACMSDLDCQLNGVCVDGVCDCLDAWKGRKCQHLDQRPGDALLRLPTSSSWGGRIIPSENPQEPHHAFITVFGGGCGMDEWDNTSHILVATIRNSDENETTRFNSPATVKKVAIPAYAHCTDVVRAKDASGRVIYIMVHNGDGMPRKNCGCGSPKCPDQPIEWLAQCDSGNGTTPKNVSPRGKPAPPRPPLFEPSNGVHVSSSPIGPWQAPPKESLVGYPFCDCPALHSLRNGSIMVWCQPLTWNFVPGQESTTINPIFINQGWGTSFVPYQPRINVPPSFLTRAKLMKNALKFDDPTLWTDENGNFHVLAHNGDGPFPAGDSSSQGSHYRDFNPYRMGCSAHIFSPDGINWNLSEFAAHNATVPLTRGRGQVNLFRERPKAVLRPHLKGYKLVALTSGAMRCGERPVGSRSDSNDPLSHCANETWPRATGEYGINTWRGMDYSFTTVVPLGT